MTEHAAFIDSLQWGDEEAIHRNAPKPSPDCFYGLIGEIAKAGSEHTEANPIALAANALVMLGAAIGNAPYVSTGDGFQNANLFICHVGQSGNGRKGTSKDLPLRRIPRSIFGLFGEGIAPKIHDGSLSSGEGLAVFVHDGFREGKDEIPPVDDKRLLVVIEEYASLLSVCKREGNTLDSVIRNVWDGHGIKPATKGSRLWATDPHICLSCDVTPKELIDRLQARDLSNGFANRFVFFYANRHQLTPRPKTTDAAVISGFAERIRHIVNFAGVEEKAAKNSKPATLTDEAWKAYEAAYLSFQASDGDLIDALLVRRPAVMLRIALILAMTDQTLTVSEKHIKSALAWVNFWTDSVKYIFTTAAEEAQADSVGENAKRILEYLVTHGRASRSEISVKVFRKNLTKTGIDDALESLLNATPPRIEVRPEKPASGIGRPTNFYSAI
jgi:hypothetical protein